MIQKLLKCHQRKQSNNSPMEVTLNIKHQRQLEKYIERLGLKLDDFKCLAGYKILGMNIRR